MGSWRARRPLAATPHAGKSLAPHTLASLESAASNGQSVGHLPGAPDRSGQRHRHGSQRTERAARNRCARFPAARHVGVLRGVLRPACAPATPHEGPPAGWRLAPFRRVEKRPFRGSLTERRRLGFAATPVSRLFDRRVGRYADSVLIAAVARDTCEADLVLSRITRLKGRVDATPPPQHAAAQTRGGRVRLLAQCGACRLNAKPESARADSSRRVRPV